MVNTFFNGDNLSELEKTIQLIYLMYKFKRSVGTQNFKNQYCVFTSTDLSKSIGFLFHQTSMLKKYLKFQNVKIDKLDFTQALDTWHNMRLNGTNMYD